MKTTSTCGLVGLALLLTWASPVLAVNGDTNPPCWRGGPGTTHQTWRFDTETNRAPEVVTNPTGSPLAAVNTNGLSAGWISTNGGTAFGTAQGFWDLGGTNESNLSHGNLVLTIPNTVSAGATRYLWVQTTALIESGLFAHPTHIVSNATQIGSSVTTFVEGVHWDPDNELWVSVWYNRRTLWSVPATGNVDTVILRGAGIGTVVDTVVVDTMQRLPAVNDSASTPANTATNLAAATLLANDGGPALSVVGVSTPSAQGGTVSLAGGVVTYTPAASYTGADSFYYTNSDCTGGTAVGQVLVTVTGATGPVANLDTFTRTQGLPLKMAITNLLANDTGANLVFKGVGPTSTNGVPVTNNAAYVFYRPPSAAPAYDVADRFSYTISNSVGTATGYVNIQVVSAPSSLVVVRLQTGVPGPNTNTVTLAGIPNYPYVVQFATNTGGSPWFNFSTNTAGSNGLWTVQDRTATNTERYYRVTTP